VTHNHQQKVAIVDIAGIRKKYIIPICFVFNIYTDNIKYMYAKQNRECRQVYFYQSIKQIIGVKCKEL